MAISDLHNKQSALNLPSGDILAVAGDMTATGSYKELNDFANFLSKEKPKFKKIVTVAGNHDLTFDREFYPKHGDKHHNPILDCEKARAIFLNNKAITYLEDEQTELDNVKIWGSPWIPPIGPWAFTVYSDAHEQEMFQKIPENTDILITHTPPRDILDIFSNQVYFEDPETKEQKMEIKLENFGSKVLMDRVEVVKPKVHVFGHIHNCSGWLEKDGVVFINASVMDNDNIPSNKPKLISILLE